MRRRFSMGLVVVAGIMLLPVPVVHKKPQQGPVAKHRLDPRFEILHNFFARSECPAKYLVSAFLEAADKNGLDWRLLPSISFIESTGGKAAPNNNLFGWDNGRAAFASPRESIFRVASYLANSAIYRDKSVDELLDTYNPDESYREKVKSIMRRLASGDS